MITFKLNQSDEKTKPKIMDLTVTKVKKKKKAASPQTLNTVSDYLIILNGAD